MKKIKLFTDLENYLKDLSELLPSEKEFLTDKSLQYSISMLMMNIINCCIDLGNEVITIKNLGYPESYKDVFNLLG